MKLYYSPNSCSLSPHICLNESGLSFDTVLASTKTHQLPDGTDFYTINPLGYVPLLEIAPDTRLREGPVIVQYIADQVPDKQLAPAAGTLERYRLMEWLNFIGTEIHKGFSPLFNPKVPAEVKGVFRERLVSRLKWVDSQLAGKDYLMGDRFCVADAYLYTTSRWAVVMQIDLSEMPNLRAFQQRMQARPAVQAALKAEDLQPV